MKMRSAFLPLIALCSMSAVADLSPFTSDGCSAFPDGTLAQTTLWLSCCEKHDYAYWKGGTSRERALADEALKACVAAVGKPDIAALMLAGVRVGGSPYLPTQFRWGFGWPYFRGYVALTLEELKAVRVNGSAIAPR